MCESVNELIAGIKKFLFDTVSGKRLTLAQWMRKFVNEHPDYTHNSILSKKVMDDLMIRLHKISIGEIQEENFSKIFPDLGCEDITCNYMKV
jgi:hypothetical protein